MKFSPTPVHIVRRLIERGYEAYIVGGAVRDKLLNRIPKDYDITTKASPEEVRKVFGRGKCRLIGRRFRLALVFENGETYEVSTFRREPTAEERKGRVDDSGVMIWNDNQFGTLKDDVHRRDFTVNALYYDVIQDKIVDKVGGVADLEARRVHCIGIPSRRFQEDPVRMLRALKLVGQHNFTLMDNVRKAIAKHAGLIHAASSARLFEELLKILSCDKSLGIFQACHKYAFLKDFFPTLDSIWTTEGGDVIRAMLQERDRCLVQEEDYYPEKSLAFATISLPYVLNSFDLERVGSFHGTPQDAADCLQSILNFFAGFDMPREIAMEIRDLAMMLPSLATGLGIARHFKSRLYPLAYELFRLLTMATGWMSDAFSALPYPGEPMEEFQFPQPEHKKRKRHRKHKKQTEQNPEE